MCFHQLSKIDAFSLLSATEVRSFSELKGLLKVEPFSWIHVTAVDFFIT